MRRQLHCNIPFETIHILRQEKVGKQQKGEPANTRLGLGELGVAEDKRERVGQGMILSSPSRTM